MRPASKRSHNLPERAKRCRAAAIIAVSILAGACSGTTDVRGYLPRGEELQKIQMGMSKSEVQSILGSPSTTATLNHQGDSFYYVSSKVENKSFFRPKVLERQVVAIRFDQSDRVAGFGHYGLEDGKVVNISSRETPVEGKEESLIRDFFGNLGKYEPGTGGGGKGGIGN